MKKVLLLIPGYSSFLTPFKKGFEDNGWQVKNFDYRRGDLLIRTFRLLPLRNARKRADELVDEKIIRLARLFEPDLILTIKGERLSKELITRLKRQNRLVVNYFPDPMSYWEMMKKIASWYDYFVHFDPMVVRKLRKKNKNILYLPFSSEIDGRSESQIYDISFIGTYSKYREKYLSTLIDFNLNIWGDPRWISSSLKKFVRGGRISQSKMKQIIKKTKININLIYNAPREGTNLRTFEVTGSGGFLLTEYVKDLENLFKLDSEVISFKSPKDLKRKVEAFLINDSLRDKIAQRGYIRAKKNHSYKIRVKEFLYEISK